jgi:hypothetical protein
MNTINWNNKLKWKSYLQSNTKYWLYEVDVTTNKKYFFLRINWKEYSIPRVLFKKILWIWNNHDGISDYVFDLKQIGIIDNSQVTRPNIEWLIITSLWRIAEYIQENQKKEEVINSLLNSIKNIVDSIISTKKEDITLT